MLLYGLFGYYIFGLVKVLLNPIADLKIMFVSYRDQVF